MKRRRSGFNTVLIRGGQNAEGWQGYGEEVATKWHWQCSGIGKAVALAMRWQWCDTES